ncbi:hypothetical protein [Rhodoferax sp.]|uniref:hypothetical protein n=1 Tax=Rhodoferax sp. TaxID=50421 RepID=UPI00374D493C
MSTFERYKKTAGLQAWFIDYVDADSARAIRTCRDHCDIYGLRNQDEINELFDAFKEEIEIHAVESDDMQLWQIARHCCAHDVERLISELVWMAVEYLAYVYQDMLDDMKKDREQDLARERGQA